MRAGQIALVSAGAALTGVLGYAFYFDYMRRNSPEFRKGLRKQQKKIKQASEAKAKEQSLRDQRELTIALVELELEQPPSSPEQMEAYFQENVATAEALAAQGPEHYVKSATHFYRALRVYPQPVELLMIYQKVCPEPVFQLVLKLTQLTSAANAGGAAAVQRVAAGGAGGAAVEDVDDESPEEAKTSAAVAEKEAPASEKEEVKEQKETIAEAAAEAAEVGAEKLEEEEASSAPPSNNGSGASWERVGDDN